jgi:integrase
MAGPTRFGINWAKIPTDAEEQSALDEAKDGHPPQYYPIFFTAASTGLRICEIMHLKWENLLPGNMLEVTRRKKRVLKPEIIDLFPEFAKFLYSYGKGKTGWMWPGGAQPCVIHRRPKFEETNCPDCNRQLLRLDQVRKKCDRITNFANHLTQEHGRTPDEVQEWIEFASKDVDERICDGGHLHCRSVQTRFRLILAKVGAYVRGRGIHAVRHAFAVQMWRKTRNLMLVKQLLGHEQVTTTQVYATAVDSREQLASIGSAL